MTTSSFCEDSQNLGSEINKTANIIAKTSQFETICKDDSGYITLLKQQKKIKKVILLVSTLTMWRYATK